MRTTKHLRGTFKKEINKTEKRVIRLLVNNYMDSFFAGEEPDLEDYINQCPTDEIKENVRMGCEVFNCLLKKSRARTEMSKTLMFGQVSRVIAKMAEISIKEMKKVKDVLKI